MPPQPRRMGWAGAMARQRLDGAGRRAQWQLDARTEVWRANDWTGPGGVRSGSSTRARAEAAPNRRE
ncbi:hypothetical protein AB1Y20_019217 [Prymnesium parvum]|uniref:Uncharacterized protein n=1 Tax=Prymnesium parvum TaxID=97485 RepID=A0AB34JQR2_PRYPA